ncbi:hypothetical protein E6U81_31605 [Streptomyces sp. A0592]|nr:hypothetical protein E6U81_31605 [Streptomyces sp. A0592]
MPPRPQQRADDSDRAHGRGARRLPHRHSGGPDPGCSDEAAARAVAEGRIVQGRLHRRRRQAALGRLTPVEFETVMTTPALQAA